MPNADPQKIGVLLIHMSVGMLVFALMAGRFIVRLSTMRPADAGTGYPVLDRITPVTHYGFYVRVTLMAGTGLATAI
jgi:cytochrome b561